LSVLRDKGARQLDIDGGEFGEQKHVLGVEVTQQAGLEVAPLSAGELDVVGKREVAKARETREQGAMSIPQRSFGYARLRGRPPLAWKVSAVGLVEGRLKKKRGFSVRHARRHSIQCASRPRRRGPRSRSARRTAHRQRSARHVGKELCDEPGPGRSVGVSKGSRALSDGLRGQNGAPF
jgi:hypothetical protein